MRLFVGNSNIVELEELTNTVTELHDDGATVTLTLLEADGDEVDGEIWPINMGYDAGDQTYRVVMSSAIDIVSGRYYTAVVRAVGSAVGSPVGMWSVRVRAEDRTAC